MAVVLGGMSGGSAPGVMTFTFRLAQEWKALAEDWEPRTPIAGDLVLIEFTKPKHAVLGPPDWSEVPLGADAGPEQGQVFWRMIGPAEIDPVFTCSVGALEWECKAVVVIGGTFAPFPAPERIDP